LEKERKLMALWACFDETRKKLSNERKGATKRMRKLTEGKSRLYQE
jgi:hypothetical protein